MKTIDNLFNAIAKYLLSDELQENTECYRGTK